MQTQFYRFLNNLKIFDFEICEILNTCIISSSLPIFYKSHINSLHHTVIVIPALAITTFCKREITLNSVYCIGWVNVVLFNLVSTMLENLQNLIQYIMTAIQHVEPPSYFQFPYWRGVLKYL